MSAPLVAASIALLWDKYPFFKNNLEITKEWLFNTTIKVEDVSCKSVSPWPNYVYGYGNIDVFKMVEQNVITCNGIYFKDPNVLN
jgi:hypothetical protein